MSVFVSQREIITHMDKISCVIGRKWEIMTCNISPKWKRPGQWCFLCSLLGLCGFLRLSNLLAFQQLWDTSLHELTSLTAHHKEILALWNLDNDVVPVLPRKKRRPLRYSSVRRRNSITNGYEIPRRIIEWHKIRNKLRQTKYNFHQIKSKTDVPEESWQICSKHTRFPPQLQKGTVCLYTGSANKNLESCKNNK